MTILRCLPLLAASVLLALSPLRALAQAATVDDPVLSAQARAAARAAPPAVAEAVTSSAAAVAEDPILAAQVLAAAEKTFPNLAADLENAELLRKAALDPTMRGNLRGRIAEAEWIKRNAKDGWRPVRNPIAPENDACRFVDGRLEGAQVKVHADWKKYINSMQQDSKAERFVVPDDHYDLVLKELEARRIGALRGGLTEKAAWYGQQQKRLTRMGRNFAELDEAIVAATKHYGRIATALRIGGKAASFLGIAIGLLDSGIAVYEVATGRAEVEDLVRHVSKTVIGGAASWAAAEAALNTAAAVGASGAVPVAVAVVIATGTYLVIDWAIDAVADALKATPLSTQDVERIWPKGARGIPLERLYQKPVDPAAVLK